MNNFIIYSSLKLIPALVSKFIVPIPMWEPLIYTCKTDGSIRRKWYNLIIAYLGQNINEVLNEHCPKFEFAR